MLRKETYSNKDRLRDYSTIFSRRVFREIIEYGDFSYIDVIAARYDNNIVTTKYPTYIQYIKYIYRLLSKEYKCEYIYKNTIINELLIKEHGTQNTIAINEFRVANSIVDIALFNGISRAFEIKTELDSDKRLSNQLIDYTKLFQECYVIVPEQLISKYSNIVDERVGIDILYQEKGRLKISSYRSAIKNESIDVDILIRSLRANEYKNIVIKKFGALPNVSCFKMFDACTDKLGQISSNELHQMFIDEIKLRTSNTSALTKFSSELRQICLSLNINTDLYQELESKLNSKINIETCICHI